MGQRTNKKAKKVLKEEIKKAEIEDVKNDDEDKAEQDGVSVQSVGKEESEVDLELKLLEALEIYPPSKLRGVHRNFVLYGLTEYMRRSFNRLFTSDEILKLLGRFYNLDLLKPEEEDAVFLSQEEDFRLPQSYFDDEDK